MCHVPVVVSFVGEANKAVIVKQWQLHKFVSSRQKDAGAMH